MNDMKSNLLREKTRIQLQQDSGRPWEVIVRNTDARDIPLEMQSKQLPYRNRPLSVLAMRDLSWRDTARRLQDETQKLTSENLALKAGLSDRDHLGNLIGKSPLMQKVYERLMQAAASRESVMIYGESGTGKELAARLIFELSAHHSKNFVPVNCGAIQAPLFEAAFFGYRKGAFTNATQNTPGYFEQADGGTLFLDEVGELPPLMQVKLLRVLNDHVYTPLGSSTPHAADLRVVAATNQELRKLKSEGKIREDFFQRLHVIALEMPPLRHHKEDLPLLVEQFLSKQPPSAPSQFPPELMDRFMDYEWPGNVRELFNELHRWVATGEVEIGKMGSAGEFQTEESSNAPLSARLERVERQIIKKALDRHDGSRVKTAEALQISVMTLHRKLKKYGLE